MPEKDREILEAAAAQKPAESAKTSQSDIAQSEQMTQPVGRVDESRVSHVTQPGASNPGGLAAPKGSSESSPTTSQGESVRQVCLLYIIYFVKKP